MAITWSQPVVDDRGNVMFFCGYCSAPITQDDLGGLGLRLPDRGETRDEYLEAELIDDLRHAGCVQAVRTG